MDIDFQLPQDWIQVERKTHVMLVATRIQMIRYGAQAEESEPLLQDNGSVSFPISNNYWLYPPTVYRGQPEGHWRLVSRYDTWEDLNLIVRVLQLWL